MRKFDICNRFSIATFTVLFCLFTFSVAAQNRTTTVEGIDVQGNRRLSDEEILKWIETRMGQTFDKEQAQADILSLLKTNHFDASQTRVITTEATSGGIIVIFEVREMPIMVQVKFDGLRYVKLEEIIGRLRSCDASILAGMPYVPQKIARSQKIILEYLIERGYTQATVFITEQEVDAIKLNVGIIIDELPGDDHDDLP